MYTSQVNYEQSDFGYKFVKNYLPPVVENYVARINGDDQYWQLSEPITINTGDEVHIKSKRPNQPATTKMWFMSGSTLRLNIQATNIFEEIGGDLYLDDVLIRNYVDEYPIDGATHQLRYELTSNRNITLLGSNRDGLERFEGVLLDFKVVRNGSVINEITLTNKDQGATQLATVGSVNATMVNYDESVWEQI